MWSYKKSFGNKGEKLASEFLERKNYKILKRNFRIWGGEIDIVARDPVTREIVFVEVKTRSKEFWQYIDETLSYTQKKFINRAAKRYLYKNNLEEFDWRVDFIGIILDENGPSIVHFKAIEM